MKYRKNHIQNLVGCFLPSGTIMAITAALLSVLTVFAFLIVICPEWYETLPMYSELITGVTTFSGYNKDADMRIVKVVLLGIPVFFFVISGVLRVLDEKVKMEKKHCYITFGGYIFWILCLINGHPGRFFFGVVLGLWILCYCILRFQIESYDEKIFEEKLVSLGIGSLLVYVALESVGSVILMFFNSVSCVNDSFLYQIPAVLTCIGTVINAICLGKNKIDMDRQGAFWQIVIPTCFIPMATFRYLYETTGENFLLFYSSKYKYFMYGLFVLFLCYGVYAFVKKKRGIYLTTLISVAMIRTFEMPEGVLNIDFFHIGEMSTPFMQFQDYGKIPFFDLMPIHGLCDYYYSFINFVFLDNTYLSMNAALVIGNLFLAALLAVVLYFVSAKKVDALVFVYFFVPFMINAAGIRYIFLFISFFVLFCTNVREKPLIYIWGYVMLSIISITWNMSIGGAGAAAFFPVVLLYYLPKAFMEFKEIITKKEKKGRGKLLFAYGFLLLSGLLYIPVFLQIVNYLRENAGTTLMANGMAMIEEFSFFKEYLTPTLFDGEQISFLQVFGFLVSFLCCLVLAFYRNNSVIRRNGREYGVIYFVCFYIISNYAFVRFDSGLRTSVLSGFFLLALLVGMRKWKRPEFWILIFMAILIVQLPMGIQMNTLADKKIVESTVTTSINGKEIEDPIVYLTGESVGMEKLGSGFIRGNTLQNLQNLKYVYETENNGKNEYLDLTNAVANYIFLDAAMVLPYTSGYNISNKLMQEATIAKLEEIQVDLVVFAPYIRFDEATFSLRSPILYEYLYEAGYKTYVYENVIYMKKGDSALFLQSNGFEEFGNLMHKVSLQMLPAVWGRSEAVGTLKEVELTADMIVEEQEVICYLGEKKKGTDIDFIKIAIPENPSSDTELHFIFGEEEKEFTFYAGGKELLIPVYSSPFWKELDDIGSFTIQVEEEGNDILTLLENATISFLNF